MALVAKGVFAAMGEGMVLEPVRTFLAKYVKGHMAMPLYDCSLCMTSVWGTMALALCWWFGVPVVWELLPVYILSAVGLLALIDT